MKNTTIVLIVGLFFFSATSIFAQPDPSDTNTTTQTTTTTNTNNTSNDPMGCQRQGNKKGQGKVRGTNNRSRGNQGRVQQGSRTPKAHNSGNGQRRNAQGKDYTSCKPKKGALKGHTQARGEGHRKAKGYGHRKPVNFDERN